MCAQNLWYMMVNAAGDLRQPAPTKEDGNRVGGNTFYHGAVRRESTPSSCAASPHLKSGYFLS